MNKIDFVLTWVDGSDESWKKLKRTYLEADAHKLSSDSETYSDIRYRDFGLLKYWFRAVERFTPWVNRIFFVTCGQKPDWLDESNPKLRLVNHEEYIPADYLPTFNSNTIELNLHRIPDLSEQFVLFNDDMFLLRPLKPVFFFRKGLPVLICDLRVPLFSQYNNWNRIIVNNCAALKQGIRLKPMILKHKWKFIDVTNLGFACAIRNILSLAINRTVIPNSFGHMPEPHLKSTFEEIWRTIPVIMDNTSRSRFRADDNINQWLANAWNMFSGRFYPAAPFGNNYTITKDTFSAICNDIRKQSFPEICINDSGDEAEMRLCLDEIHKAFDSLLPDKSSFEK